PQLSCSPGRHSTHSPVPTSHSSLPSTPAHCASSVHPAHSPPSQRAAPGSVQSASSRHATQRPWLASHTPTSHPDSAVHATHSVDPAASASHSAAPPAQLSSQAPPPPPSAPPPAPPVDAPEPPLASPPQVLR